MNILCAPYFRSTLLWDKLFTFLRAGDAIIVNPDSGPGIMWETFWRKTIGAARSKRLKVLGYVRTQWANRDGDAPLSAVAYDCAKWRAFYKVNDFFFDEASTGIIALTQYYQFLRDANPQSFIVLNPGVLPAEEYMKVCDVAMTFESRAANYPPTVPPWVRKYPRSKFSHVVFDSATFPLSIVTAAKQANVGWLWITVDDHYDTLPPYLGPMSAAIHKA